MRTAAYEVDVAMRPPQARVSQAKLFVLVYPAGARSKGRAKPRYCSHPLGAPVTVSSLF